MSKQGMTTYMDTIKVYEEKLSPFNQNNDSRKSNCERMQTGKGEGGVTSM